MKLLILRAIYFGGKVVTEGDEIETLELHGRELIQKGYASEVVINHAAEQQEQQEQQETKQTKAKKEK
ncbi:hypothetical protein [Providencia rettgeri]|uniref:DUF7210 family protein n=1 Tax=Providencia rettgeri TaxID=587 RepID=UPI0023627900|nr:hypothetical protein [Providencia rettgeri]